MNVCYVDDLVSLLFVQNFLVNWAFIVQFLWFFSIKKELNKIIFELNGQIVPEKVARLTEKFIC